MDRTQFANVQSNTRCRQTLNHNRQHLDKPSLPRSINGQSQAKSSFGNCAHGLPVPLLCRSLPVPLLRRKGGTHYAGRDFVPRNEVWMTGERLGTVTLTGRSWNSVPLRFSSSACCEAVGASGYGRTKRRL